MNRATWTGYTTAQRGNQALKHKQSPQIASRGAFLLIFPLERKWIQLSFSHQHVRWRQSAPITRCRVLHSFLFRCPCIRCSQDYTALGHVRHQRQADTIWGQLLYYSIAVVKQLYKAILRRKLSTRSSELQILESLLFILFNSAAIIEHFSKGTLRRSSGLYISAGCLKHQGLNVCLAPRASLRADDSLSLQELFFADEADCAAALAEEKENTQKVAPMKDRNRSIFIILAKTAPRRKVYKQKRFSKIAASPMLLT